MPELEPEYYPDFLYTDENHDWEITREKFGPMYQEFYAYREHFFFKFNKASDSSVTNTYNGEWSLGLISGTLTCTKKNNASTWRGTMTVTGKHYEGDDEGVPPLNWTASLIVTLGPNNPSQVEITWIFNNGPTRNVACKKVWTIDTQVRVRAKCVCSIC